MKLDRKEFIKSLEAKQQAYLEEKQKADRVFEEQMQDYLTELARYRKKIALLLAEGAKYTVSRRYSNEVTVEFDGEVQIPEPPKKPSRESNYYETYGGSTKHTYENRAKLISTLLVSTENEITLSKQILDLV